MYEREERYEDANAESLLEELTAREPNQFIGRVPTACGAWVGGGSS